jgi:hypothetical protein
MLIDTTYFFGDCSIGQLSESAVAAKLTLFMQKYEPEYLLGVLGYDTMKAFLTGLATNPIPSIWTDLRDGKEYTDVNGRPRKWRGLLQSDIKISPIAYYVYFNYQANQATNTGGTGETVLTNENATNASPSAKMVYAWNRMVHINRELFDFLFTNQTSYPDWLNSVYQGYGLYGAYRTESAEKFLTTLNTFGI